MKGVVYDGPGDLRPATAGPLDPEWSALLERLFIRARGGMVLGLERMAAVLEQLGHPERALPAVHVAGTNGKGSTSAFLASILAQVEGRRVGLYTSPHLSCFSERFQLVSRDGARALDRSELLAVFARLEALAPDFFGLTFFEIVTAAALLAFRDESVDALIAEAGLGARLDATRMVDARVSVLTRIDLDHRAILGDTVTAIAAEKAYVARPGRPLFMDAAAPEVVAVVRKHAREIGAPVFLAGEDFAAEPSSTLGGYRFTSGGRSIDGITLGLRGPHQVDNALLATWAALEFWPELSDEQIRRGLSSVSWPGRFERLEAAGRPIVILDGAHNPDGASSLRRAVEAEPDLTLLPMHWVAGTLEDKEAGRMFEFLCDRAISLDLCPPPSPRALAPEALVPRLPTRYQGAIACFGAAEAALEAALERARRSDGFVLVAGSLYLVGALRPLLLASGYAPVAPVPRPPKSESLPRPSGEC